MVIACPAAKWRVLAVTVETTTGMANILVFRDDSLEPFAKIPLSEPYIPYLTFCPSTAEVLPLATNAIVGCRAAFRCYSAFAAPVLPASASLRWQLVHGLLSHGSPLAHVPVRDSAATRGPSLPPQIAVVTASGSLLMFSLPDGCLEYHRTEAFANQASRRRRWGVTRLALVFPSTFIQGSTLTPTWTLICARVGFLSRERPNHGPHR